MPMRPCTTATASARSARSISRLTSVRVASQTLEATRKAFIARQPIGRLGTTQEVAALAVFLASDESSYITGQPYLVDGGMAL
jgi:2-keto-3-deoxy-L-fuconate dehydrogenase